MTLSFNNPGVHCRIFGTPAPQGSKKGFIRGGRVNLVESSAKVKPWRQDVKFAMLDQVGSVLLSGPLTADVTFWLPRGTSIPKKRKLPWKKPDIDKLLRSTFDGIGEAGVWRDDAQVVETHVYKFYAHDERPPGADIHIRELEGE